MKVRFELFVQDIQKSVDFYTNVLKFSVKDAYPDYVSVQNGSVAIGICPIETLRSGHYFLPQIQEERKGLGVEIVLEAENVEQEFARIKNAQYHIFEELTKQEWGLTDFRIVDPDGYYLRITS